MSQQLALVVGSPRTASVHRRLAEAARAYVPSDVTVDLVDGLDRLPFYNEDIDTDPTPAAVTDLRARIAGADAVLLLSPANNGTLTAVLKNAIDWASRPYGQSSLSGKPVAVVSAAHRTDTVVEHTHLAVTIAGGVPVEEAVAGFSLKDLTDADLTTHPEVAAALRHTVATVLEAARNGASAA